MVEPNVSELTSDYVLSSPSRSEVVGSARKASRDRPTATAVQMDSMIPNAHVTPEIYNDRYSSKLPSSNSDVETSVDIINEQPKNRPLFKLNAQCIQAILYPMIVLIYLVIGAAIFTAIESEHEKMTRNDANQEIDEAQQVIETVLREFNIPENTTKEILSNISLWCADYSKIQNLPYQWEFLPSFYFAATVITTIGENVTQHNCYYHSCLCFNRLWTVVAKYKSGTSVSLCVCSDGNTSTVDMPSNSWQIPIWHMGFCTIMYCLQKIYRK